MGGGEVSLLKDFDEQAAWALDKDKSVQMVVHTNGIVWSESVARLLKGRTQVSISPDAGTRETYLRIKGADAFEKVRRNIVRYAAFGRLVLKYIVNEYNCGREDLLGFADIVGQSKNIVPQLSFTAEACRSRVYPASQIAFACDWMEQFQQKGIGFELFGPFVLPDAIDALNRCAQLRMLTRQLQS